MLARAKIGASAPARADPGSQPKPRIGSLRLRLDELVPDAPIREFDTIAIIRVMSAPQRTRAAAQPLASGGSRSYLNAGSRR